ncbi:hypothetical protein CHCC14821_2634 [Bacillus paralicheniformis]|nr:hypothetical protein CHCC14821_2634 [Bacillus paralicheniformis]
MTKFPVVPNSSSISSDDHLSFGIPTLLTATKAKTFQDKADILQIGYILFSNNGAPVLHEQVLFVSYGTRFFVKFGHHPAYFLECKT